jgi:hypothetical protein
VVVEVLVVIIVVVVVVIVVVVEVVVVVDDEVVVVVEVVVELAQFLSVKLFSDHKLRSIFGMLLQSTSGLVSFLAM